MAMLLDREGYIVVVKAFVTRAEERAYLRGYLDAVNMHPDDVQWTEDDPEVVAVLRVPVDEYQ